VVVVLKLKNGSFSWYGIYKMFCYGRSENAVVTMVHFDRMAWHLLYDTCYIQKRRGALEPISWFAVHIQHEAQDLLYYTQR
jgi:hypothetical protein